MGWGVRVGGGCGWGACGRVVTHAEPRKHHRRAKLRSLATLEHVLFRADVNTSRAHHAHSKR